MQTLAWLAVALILAVRPDPAPGLLQTKADAGRFECERVTPESVHVTHPGEMRPTKPRGDFVDRAAVVCTERLMRPGLRDVRDEAILTFLDERTAELAASAQAARPDLDDRTWLVETFYPNAEVQPKIAFATKNALMGQGLAVSDRLVTLGAGDIDVLTRMSPDRAFPSACKRYSDIGSLGDGDALLAVVSRDPRETVLHAGLCDRGQWTWLR